MGDGSIPAQLVYLADADRNLLERLVLSTEFPGRDQLAAMAMQGLVSDPNVPMQSPLQIAAVARLAHQMADAMLAERSRA